MCIRDSINAEYGDISSVRMGHAKYDEEDFDDFLTKVNSIDAAIKGMRDGSVTVEDVDNEHSELLRLGEDKDLQEKSMKEKELKKQVEKVPLHTREQAIERVKLAEKTGKPELVRLAEDQLRDTERRLQKKKELNEWKEERTAVLRDELRSSKIRQERWELWKAAHPKYAKKYETNYDAWDKWEPIHEIEDNEENLMPDSNRPELKAMEEDIEKRARARKARIKEGTDLKDEGNRAFKEGRLQNAGELYGAALSSVPWLTSAFTNRALVYLKQGNFQGALNDCKEALAVADYNGDKPEADICLKAMKRKAEAYEGLQKWAKAIKELEAALVLAPANKDLEAALTGTKLRWEQSKSQAEMRARVEAEASDPAVKDLTKVSAALSEIAEGSGELGPHLEVLKQQLREEDARVLFRELKGVEVLVKALGGEHDEAALSVLCVACLNSFNIADFVALKGSLKAVSSIALSEQAVSVRAMAVQLLALVSDEEGDVLRSMAKEPGMAAFVTALLSKESTLLHNTLVLVRNLSGSTGFRGSAREVGLLEALGGLLSPHGDQSDLEAAAGAMSLLINDTVVRGQVTDAMIAGSINILKTSKCEAATALNTLGFLLNACVEETTKKTFCSQNPAALLKPFVKQTGSAVATRAMGLAARVAQHGDCAKEFVDAGFVPLAVPSTLPASGEDMQSASVRMLTVLVAKCDKAVGALKKTDFFEKATALMTLENQGFVGNLSMLISRVAGNAENLDLFASYVAPLVTIMHKTSGATQKNAAIACAKLARKPEYLQQIRDLHGIEIMFHYVKP
eukprot:TRINITY_DN4390_c0_g2_i2.p1 TRINITY_DN4390_c0_g2~~TRINITY_DN4390_c0_g2_i2.p1  ORF type:complete len:807 (+),score=282.11 TRINITY_DN4390_c0_g2_i2:28-2421(+)